MPREKGKHLTMAERMLIEDSLNQGESIGNAAKRVGVSWSAVAYEVKSHRTRESPKWMEFGDRNLCAHQRECKVRAICGNGCRERCASCMSAACNRVCNDFVMMPDCPKCDKAPFVCNGCKGRLTIGCKHPHWYYDARMADQEAAWTKSSSRSGIDCTEQQLKEMVRTVKPLLRKGQSLQHIWQAHGHEFPVSYRTFYRYVDLGALEVINLDLPRKVKYKPRRRQVDGNVPFKPNLAGRTYADFCALSNDEQMSAVEMDCVVSARGCDKAILTLLFRRYSFQLMVMMPAHTAGCVKAALDHIEMLCGKDGFRRHFGIILTDRGSEFLGWQDIETSIDGERRCQVFYCDPLQSGQKGRCEKNHVELRRILPKGTSFAGIGNWELSTICSHVNSYTRPYLGGLAPIDIASAVLPEDLLEGLAIRKVPADDVIMRPTLLKELGMR